MSTTGHETIRKETARRAWRTGLARVCDWRDQDYRRCTRSDGHPGDHTPEVSR